MHKHKLLTSVGIYWKSTYQKSFQKKQIVLIRTDYHVASEIFILKLNIINVCANMLLKQINIYY